LGGAGGAIKSFEGGQKSSFHLRRKRTKVAAGEPELRECEKTRSEPLKRRLFYKKVAVGKTFFVAIKKLREAIDLSRRGPGGLGHRVIGREKEKGECAT